MRLARAIAPMLARYAPHPCHRPLPLLHPLARWLDDQLAFNEILWTGYRNHPDGAIAAARKDGKVIRIRLAGERYTTASWPELDSSTPTAAYCSGFGRSRMFNSRFIMARSSPAPQNGRTLAGAPPRRYPALALAMVQKMHHCCTKIAVLRSDLGQ